VSDDAQVVATGVPFGEGPVWCPDGTLVCTSISHGTLLRIQVDTGQVRTIGDTAGGANSAALASDGSFVVCQNGGIDLAGLHLVPDAPPVRWTRSGLQHVGRDGTVRYLTAEPLQAPNDLVVGADGTVWFTDPGAYPPQGRTSRVLAHRQDGSLETVVDGYAYVNGIALDPNGSSLVVVADDRQLVRLHAQDAWRAEVVVADLGESGGDGLCLDVEGRYYVAGRLGSHVNVYEPDGALVDVLPLGVDGFLTNCCFGGPELRDLYATDARGNQVVVWSGMPTAGLPLHRWPVPSG
jgi:gluconolactonase